MNADVSAICKRLADRLFAAEQAVIEHMKAKRPDGDEADELLWEKVLGYPRRHDAD